MITLSTGTTIDAFKDIIGLDEAGAVLEGYDGILFDPEYDSQLDFEPGLTPAERVELGDIMLARWQIFKDAASEDLAKGDHAP